MGALTESEPLTDGSPEVGSRFRDVFEDLGQRVELEAEIVELDRATAFGDVSEECRTLLTLILGPSADLLAGAHGTLSKEQREQIRLLHDSGIHLLELLQGRVGQSRTSEPEEFEAEVVAPDPSTGRILIADDDPSILESLSGVLRDSGFDVAAADGRESLFRELGNETPDLLLLDVIMPGADGVQLFD